MQNTKVPVLVFGALFGVVLSPVSGKTPKLATPNLSQIQAVLAKYPRQILSMQSTSTIETKLGNASYLGNQDPKSAPPADNVSKETWAFKDGKLYDHLTDLHDSFTVAPREFHSINRTWIYDGKSQYLINAEKTDQGVATYGNLQHHLAGDPGWPPLSFGYKYSLNWIGDILKHGAVIEGAVNDPAYGPLIIVSAKYRDSNLRFWLAPKYGYVAVKTEAHTQYTGTVKLSTYSASGYREYGHLWMPTIGQFSGGRIENNKRSTFVTKAIRFSNIKINQTPDSLFAFKFPIGSALWDEDLQKKYIMNPSGKWVQPVGFNRRMHADSPASL